MTRKRKAKAVEDNAGKELMEEDVLEEEMMDEDSPPRKDPQAKEEDENLPHCV